MEISVLPPPAVFIGRVIDELLPLEVRVFGPGSGFRQCDRMSMTSIVQARSAFKDGRHAAAGRSAYAVLQAQSERESPARADIQALMAGLGKALKDLPAQ